MLNKLPNELLYEIAKHMPINRAGDMFRALGKPYRPLKSSFHGKQKMVTRHLRKNYPNKATYGNYKTYPSETHKYAKLRDKHIKKAIGRSFKRRHWQPVKVGKSRTKWMGVSQQNFRWPPRGVPVQWFQRATPGRRQVFENRRR